MIGTIINVGTVLVGGAVGLYFGARLSERVRQTVVAGLGLFTAAYGLHMFTQTENPIIVLISILLGGVFGEWARIEERLRKIGVILERRFTDSSHFSMSPSISTQSAPADIQSDTSHDAGLALQNDKGKFFIRGFLTASLVFCVGPMAILGSIQDGLTGDFNTLAIKSVMDGFASVVFASSLGVGVLFSALVVLAYQGSITLLSAQAQEWISVEMMSETTAVGGVLLLGIAVSSLLEIKPIRVGNFLPALVFAPVLLAIIALLGWR